MNGHQRSSLSPMDVYSGIKEILSSFNPKGAFSLTEEGLWIENPQHPRDCISNEILFRLWKAGESVRESFSRGIATALKDRDFRLLDPRCVSSAWSLASGTFSGGIEEPVRSKEKSLLPESARPALACLNAVVYLLWIEAVNILTRLHISPWDTARLRRRDRHLQALEIMESGLRDSWKDASSAMASQVWSWTPELHTGLPELIAEETDLTQSLEDLLAQADNPDHREECWGLICEKLHPPMGIVTNTSPSLLRPCLMLLSRNIDLASGIPFQASVILGILQDPRSTRTMLDGLSRLPLAATKIRENLCYTLGSLGEEEAVPHLQRVLDGPDQILGRDGKSANLLTEQKAEALRAMGKIGLPSLAAMSSLSACVDNPSLRLKTHLAWTLGRIGSAQKSSFGGVSADILISLLRLLKVKSKEVFEESTKSLLLIDMPAFIHSLYLYNIGAVSLLGLKPANRGLYELSETVQSLIRTKGRVVVAVNGDSGTGKTYFCQSIKDGFAGVAPCEVLYLMRDRKKDQKIFNRMLGLRWLKKHIDPIYYTDYPLTEEEDDPDLYFKNFLEENKGKKIIILDGCRDRNYFQRVIDLFYFSGKLDVEVNFRASFASRRQNLEEREVALESMRNHLSFLEEPALEDTLFYRENRVILYDLDNSLDCRLERQDIQELFAKPRIGKWLELIRLGEFPPNTVPPEAEETILEMRTETFVSRRENREGSISRVFSHQEKFFTARLNPNPASKPYSLKTIDMSEWEPIRLEPYAQDQIAGLGISGQVFVLTLKDRHLFWTREEKARHMILLGRDIFLFGEDGSILRLSFEKEERSSLGRTDSSVSAAAPLLTTEFVTGHSDGTLRIWDFPARCVTVLEGHRDGILSIASDYEGRIYSSSRDGSLRRWDLKTGRCTVLERQKAGFSLHAGYRGNIHMTGKCDGESPGSFLEIIDFNKKTSTGYRFPRKINSVRETADGRLVLSLADSPMEPSSGTLLVFSPQKTPPEAALLPGHTGGTRDCLLSGPSILTCGEEGPGHSIKIWGGAYFVRTELGKLAINPE